MEDLLRDLSRVVLVDPDLTVAVSNRPSHDLLGLPPGTLVPGAPVRSLLLHVAEQDSSRPGGSAG